jgi:hypothetical protein
MEVSRVARTMAGSLPRRSTPAPPVQAYEDDDISNSASGTRHGNGGTSIDDGQ